jgi:hypothetical protein
MVMRDLGMREKSKLVVDDENAEGRKHCSKNGRDEHPAAQEFSEAIVHIGKYA